MRALFYDGELRLIEDYPRPTPPPGEALVRVKLAGICNTDLEIVRGYMGFRGVHAGFDHTHEFVAQHTVETHVAAHDLQVGIADAGQRHPDQRLAGRWFRPGIITDQP